MRYQEHKEVTCISLQGLQLIFNMNISTIESHAIAQLNTPTLNETFYFKRQNARITDEIVNAAAKSVITFASFAVAGGLIGSAFPVIGTGFGALGGIGLGIANAFITYHNYQKDLKNIEEIVLNQLKNQQGITLGQ